MSLSSTQHVPKPPPKRDVARPVANLGNTCYVNAVLQALAHAPELCMAVDVEPHHVNCPIYLDNLAKGRASPTSSPDSTNSGTEAPKQPTRKSKRSSSGKKSPVAAQETKSSTKFCALCEIEFHLAQVHGSSASNQARDNKPVAPSAFVNGFIEHVAPWFRLGDQEDSHEFLRLLIDAMQKSCKQARAQENPQDTPPERTGNGTDQEYPFQLFRGTVESQVICGSCEAVSSTLDPIEDIGLDVTQAASGKLSTTALADVGSALQCFSRAEALDSGYKCEKCGKLGRATKQSRLASIPPILTLHLKRFRYGETVAQQAASTTSTGSSRRSARSEVSQLLWGSNSAPADYLMGGKSGSAKIEGHLKFEQILDLHPYLTPSMQAKHTKMFCRLFAVVVHAGKNSHSGHYIAYVRNVAKNEWWKMDDARVTLASVQEVMKAEAYMLFYRVVEHPFAIGLRKRAEKLQDELAEAAAKAATAAEAADEVTGNSSLAENPTGGAQEAAAKADGVATRDDVDKNERARQSVTPMEVSKSDSTSLSSTTGSDENSNNKINSRKRKAPEFLHGEDWARAKTRLPEHLISKIGGLEQSISEFITFKPEFFKVITDQASKGNAKVGHGPTGVSENDIGGDGPDHLKEALIELLYEFTKQVVTSEKNNSLWKVFKRDEPPAPKPTPTLREAVTPPRVEVITTVVDPDADNLL